MCFNCNIKPKQFCRYGPSLLWAEFVWDELVMGGVCMGRVGNGPSLLWAEMSSSRQNHDMFSPATNLTRADHAGDLVFISWRLCSPSWRLFFWLD